MEWERIEAAEIAIGDRIARTRNETPQEVSGITPGAKSSYITLIGAGRIRPRHSAKFWRAHGWIGETPGSQQRWANRKAGAAA